MATNCGPGGKASCRPPWNVACVDYACGNYTTNLSLLRDPATMNVPGCSYSTSTSGTGGGRLSCNSPSFEGVLAHINWGPVGGHGCTALNISKADPAATTLLIDDAYFFNDTGLCSVAVNDNGIWINVSHFFSGGVIFSNAYLDFNSSHWDSTVGGCSGTSSCNPNKINLGNNTVVEKYLVIRNSSGNPLTGSAGGSSINQTIEYSWVENWCSRGPNCHAEAFDGRGGSPQSFNTVGELTIDHNVILQGQTISTFGPTTLWIASTYPMEIDKGPNITNNTIINSFAGGRPKRGVTVSGCVGNTWTGSACSGAGNTLFVTSETAPVGYGADMNCSGGAILTYKQIAGPYPSGIVDEYMTDGFSANQYAPTFTIPGSPFDCKRVVVSSRIGGNSAITATHAATPFGSPNYSGNYVDVTSFSSSRGLPQIWQITTADRIVSVPSGTISTTGGVSTLDTGGMHAQFGAYVNGIGVDGCSINVQSCPRIVSESGGIYTLNRAVTPVGPMAMTINPINWCANSCGRSEQCRYDRPDASFMAKSFIRSDRWERVLKKCAPARPGKRQRYRNAAFTAQTGLLDEARARGGRKWRRATAWLIAPNHQRWSERPTPPWQAIWEVLTSLGRGL